MSFKYLLLLFLAISYWYLYNLCFQVEYIYSYFGNPRVVQWLGLSASTAAVGPVSIPSQGTKIQKAARYSKK